MRCPFDQRSAVTLEVAPPSSFQEDRSHEQCHWVGGHWTLGSTEDTKCHWVRSPVKNSFGDFLCHHTFLSQQVCRHSMCPSAAEGALVSPTMLVPSCPSQACFWVLVVCVSCQCQLWVSKYQNMLQNFCKRLQQWANLFWILNAWFFKDLYSGVSNKHVHTPIISNTIFPPTKSLLETTRLKIFVKKILI